MLTVVAVVPHSTSAGPASRLRYKSRAYRPILSLLPKHKFSWSPSRPLFSLLYFPNSPVVWRWAQAQRTAVNLLAPAPRAHRLTGRGWSMMICTQYRLAGTARTLSLQHVAYLYTPRQRFPVAGMISHCMAPLSARRSNDTVTSAIRSSCSIKSMCRILPQMKAL